MSTLWLTAVAPTPKPTFAVSGWNRCRPLGSCTRRHRGLDFRARIGTDIFSILPGTVVTATESSGDAGKFVAILHEGGLVSRYLHLSKILVSEGDFVTHGQRIGKSGDSGAKGRPHLHFDLLMPEESLSAYIELYGFPNTGFTKDDSGLFRVPSEPVVPINAGHRHVFREAARANIPVRFELPPRSNRIALSPFPALPFIVLPSDFIPERNTVTFSGASTTAAAGVISLLLIGAATFGGVMGSAVAKRSRRGAVVGAVVGGGVMVLLLKQGPVELS